MEGRHFVYFDPNDANICLCTKKVVIYGTGKRAEACESNIFKCNDFMLSILFCTLFYALHNNIRNIAIKLKHRLQKLKH